MDIADIRHWTYRSTRRLTVAAGLLAAVAASLSVSACGDDTTPSSASPDSTSGTRSGSSDGSGADADTAGATDSSQGDVAKADSGKTTAPCKPWLTPAEWSCEAGTHCGYDNLDKIACVPDGAHGVGEDCSDGQGCKIGLCVTAQNGSQACSPYCTTDAHCDSGSCNKIVGKTYSVCDVAKYQSCNPLKAACPAGQACYLLTGGFVCANAGDKTKGEGCVSHTDCAPGLACAGAGGGSSGICRLLCSKTAKPNGCDSPDTNCSTLGGDAGYCEQ